MMNDEWEQLSEKQDSEVQWQRRNGEIRVQAASDILRLKHCPQCDYSLEGLGAEGRCPECGWAFTAQHIILYGQVHRMDGSSSPLDPTNVYGYVSIALLIVGGVCMRFLAPSADDRAFGVLLAGIGLVMLPLFLFNRWRARRAQRENAGPWQFRIGPDGWGIRFGPGELKLNPWQRDVTIEARRLSDGRCLLSIMRTKKMLLATLRRRDVSIESAAIIVEAELQDLAPVVERAARWLGTTVDRRLSNRKDWIFRAQAREV